MWRLRAFGPWIGATGLVVGIPGMLDDAASWLEWLDMLGPAWSGVLVGIGATLIFLWAVNSLPVLAGGVRRTVLLSLGLGNTVSSENVKDIRTMTVSEFEGLKEKDPQTMYLLCEDERV